MMAVRYHRCTCHQRYNGGGNAPSTYSAISPSDKDGSYSKFIPCNANGHGGGGSNGGHHHHQEDQQKKSINGDDDDASDQGDGDGGKSSPSPQPWYFHVVASLILVVHGFTFLVPHDPEAEDTDMVRTVAGWVGYDMDWVKHFTPYAQGLASVFNISLGIVSWWTSKESERYNRLIQLRVFAFCLNILHAYITGPIVYQSEDVPLIAAGKTGRIIGLFRLSYLTPGLMAAGVTEVIVQDKEDGSGSKKDEDEEDEDEPALEVAPPVVEEKKKRKRR